MVEEVTVRRVHINKVGVHPVPEHLDHLFRALPCAKAVVHKNAGKLLPDSLDQQGRDYR